MKQAYFITGTDTEIGKTWCSATLMHYFRRQGLSVIGMKPIASGCHRVDGQLRNEDALILQENASKPIAYELVNPYAFEQPVSPHIASAEEGKVIDLSVIKEKFEVLKNRADVIIVEGVGGWMAPLTASDDVSDLALALQLPVILVVGIRLGCINHARLSYSAIKAKGVQCAGWIANCTQADMLAQKQNIQTIKAFIDVPLLGEIAFSPETDFTALSKYIEL
jgi:dethiobiotin synthetase